MPGAEAAWAPRIEAVKKANSLTPLADPTMERWFTDAFKPRNPGRWKQIHATIAGTTPAGYLGCAAAILNFDFTPKLPSLKVPALVVCGAMDEGTPPAGNRKIAELVPGARYEEIANARHFPNVEHPEVFNKIMMAGSASTAEGRPPSPRSSRGEGRGEGQLRARSQRLPLTRRALRVDLSPQAGRGENGSHYASVSPGS